MNNTCITMVVDETTINECVPTLKSLKSQTIKDFEVEIHVYDDVLRKARPRVRNAVDTDRRFRFIVHKEPFDLLESAHTHSDDFILVASPTSIYESDYVSECITRLKSNPEMLYSPFLSPSVLTESGFQDQGKISSNSSNYMFGSEFMIDARLLKSINYDFNTSIPHSAVNLYLHFLMVLSDKKTSSIKPTIFKSYSVVKDHFEYSEVYSILTKIDPELKEYTSKMKEFYEPKVADPISKFNIDPSSRMFR